MSDEPVRILVFEDNPTDVLLLREHLAEMTGSARFVLSHVDRLAAGLVCLGGERFDVVLLDLGLPDSQGIDTLTRVKPHAGQAAIVVLTALDDEELGVRAIEEGAQDYLVKVQVQGALFARALRYAIQRKRLE